ncbi:hypothetical protein VMCG_03967 [Cytospora schulzeri]|uniref:UDP-N-acetylglucosamine transferase subunit ALG14 n=1 Tax=Cytospora schulzeri TaxID=448051 RepID=A0A423WU20_9PEZI|nr:hypothetical protein VMCG_03967 [Valsa malicola]
MAPPMLPVNKSGIGEKEEPGQAVTPNDHKPGLNEPHLVDVSKTGILYGLCIASATLLLAVALCLYSLGIATTLSALTTLGLLVVTRHFSILRRRKPVDVEAGTQKPGPDLSHLPAVSYLYVMGSGGHSTEMFSLIQLSFGVNHNQHRRYIIARGDEHSQNRKEDVESAFQESCPDGSAGTHDAFIVTRARGVGQSYFTSVYSSLECARDILDALTTVPAQRIGQPNAAGFKFPHVIVTNGPGTGFVVGLMAHILKMLYLVPQDRLKIIFVETWARTHSLGVTGKLFYWTGITDLFVVQSTLLSKVTGKPNIGNLNRRMNKARQQQQRDKRKK